MNKEEQLQRLLRLKRHERPDEDFVPEFLTAFQKRQRTDMMQYSARAILWERLCVFIDGLRRPPIIWGSLAAYGIFLLALRVWPTASPQSPLIIVNEVKAHPAATSIPVNAGPAGGQITPVTVPAPPPGRRRTIDDAKAGN
jgi:hypothetical protein